MARLKRLNFVYIVLCMVVLCSGCGSMENLVGDLETAQRAEEVNKHGLMVVVDGVELETAAKMSKNMHLMMPVREVAEFLKVQVQVSESDTCYIDGQRIESALIRETSDEGEEIWIDFFQISSVLNVHWEWMDEAYLMSITSIDEDKLPAVYDLREIRPLNSVADQGSYGTCWAFASIAALEMAEGVDEDTHFSVDHMTMNNGFCISPTDGGDYNMAIAYLSAWEGPVYEADDMYGDGETNADLTAVKHLQEVQILKEKNIDDLKRWIIKFGGVESPIFMSILSQWDETDDYDSATYAYYYTGDEKANHDVVIVGWDDSYSRENFKRMPEQDGAFICRNSWGEAFGDEGYFYVSYEDAVLGQQAVVYSRLDYPDNYSRIYQSDMLGWVGTLGYGEESAWFANVYTAQSDEQLKAVSFYAVGPESCYDLFVVTDYTNAEDLSQGTYLGSGYLEESGYYTIDLTKTISVDSGESFAIVVCMTTPDYERPIAIEYKSSDITKDVNLEDGQGFVSYDGTNWSSSEQEYECNICLKAFTD